MAPVLMHLHSTFRSGRAAAVSLILLIGLAGGLVLSAAAGARRTETAFPRLLQSSKAADALISPAGIGTRGFYADIERLPDVAAVGPSAACLAFAPVGASGQEDFFSGVAAMDARTYFDVERPKLLAGRAPRPDRADEALANKRLADAAGLSVGDRRNVIAMPSDAQTLGEGIPVSLTIVGIGVFPGEVVPSTQLDEFPTLYVTPAYLRQHPEQPGCEGLVVRLRPGAKVERFRIAANRVAEEHREETGGEIFFQNQRLRNEKVVRAIRPQAIALWLFALLTGATFLIVIGQLLARQGALAAVTSPALRALGMTRHQLFVASLLRTAIVAVAGAGLAVVLAMATSPLMPIGPARLAEPSPGFSVNAGLLGLGFAGIVVLLLGVTALPLWRSALGERGEPGARSRIARSVTEAGLPPSAGIGIGMALEPGRGRTAVPVRGAIISAVLAMAAGTTAVIFGANLDRLVKTPSLYGWRWDAIMDTGFGLVPKSDIARIASLRSVSALVGGHYGGGNVTVNGQAVPAVGLDLVKGEVYPRLVAGRPARADDEVVLGVKVAKRVAARLGTTVRIGGIGSAPRTMRVTGIAVFPALGHGSFEPTGLGEGVAVTASVLAAGSEAADAYTFAAVRFSPTVDPATALKDVQQEFNKLELCFLQLCQLQTTSRTPADISNYARVRSTPIALAAAFGLLAAATLGHTLVTAVNRRRRDLAVMKTVGFVRRQVSASIAWQASTVAIVALLFGLPIGVATGRWLWITFADQLGVPFDPRIPSLPLLIAVPATVLIANIVAAIPGRSAGRTRAALVLRAE